MDKKTFYKELTERLKALDLGPEYIDRHINQFEGYFKGKSDEQVEAEIAKLGDLDRVAARIKRMTDKVIAEAQASQKANEQASSDVANRSDEEISQEAKVSAEDEVSPADNSSDDDMHIAKSTIMTSKRLQRHLA